MSITPITQPSAPSQPQDRSLSWHDKVLRSLQIANQVFNIPVAFSEWEKNREITEEKELANRETKTQQEGLETPGSLKAGGLSEIPQEMEQESQEKGFGRTINIATFDSEGNRSDKQIRVAPTKLLDRLSIADKGQRDQALKEFRESASAADKKKIAEAVKAVDEVERLQSQHKFIRGNMSGEKGKLIGQLSASYLALEQFEDAISKGVPANRLSGDNIGTAAADRFTEYYLRVLTGAAATQSSLIDKVQWVEKEYERVKGFLPQAEDSYGAAITKISNLKNDIVIQAAPLGNGGTKGFKDYIGSVRQVTNPLLKDIKFDRRSESKEGSSRLLEKGRDVGLGIIEAVSETAPIKGFADFMKEKTKEAVKLWEEQTGQRLSPEEVKSFGPLIDEESQPPQNQSIQPQQQAAPAPKSLKDLIGPKKKNTLKDITGDKKIIQKRGTR